MSHLRSEQPALIEDIPAHFNRRAELDDLQKPLPTPTVSDSEEVYKSSFNKHKESIPQSKLSCIQTSAPELGAMGIAERSL